MRLTDQIPTGPAPEINREIAIASAAYELVVGFEEDGPRAVCMYCSSAWHNSAGVGISGGLHHIGLVTSRRLLIAVCTGAGVCVRAARVFTCHLPAAARCLPPAADAGRAHRVSSMATPGGPALSTRASSCGEGGGGAMSAASGVPCVTTTVPSSCCVSSSAALW